MQLLFSSDQGIIQGIKVQNYLEVSLEFPVLLLDSSVFCLLRSYFHTELVESTLVLDPYHLKHRQTTHHGILIFTFDLNICIFNGLFPFATSVILE